MENQIQEDDYKPSVSDHLVNVFAVFEENFNPKIDVLYYPCCANDVSISTAFPGKRVIYVDINEKEIESLKEYGCEAYCESALEFKPDQPVDLLFLLNPQINPKKPIQVVTSGGYVLCNNYHRTADEMLTFKDFYLRGIISQQSNNILLMEGNLDDYWKEGEDLEDFWKNVGNLKTEEEFKKLFGLDSSNRWYIVPNDKKEIEQIIGKRIFDISVDDYKALSRKIHKKGKQSEDPFLRDVYYDYQGLSLKTGIIHGKHFIQGYIFIFQKL